MTTPLYGLIAMSALLSAHSVQNLSVTPPPAVDTAAAARVIEPTAHLTDFQVIELRRYIIKKDERDHFATFFDAYFPEAFQQLGTIVAGSFLERANPDTFTWIRGCHTVEERGVASAHFYYGPVWKEHRKEANAYIANADNDILLRPLRTERSVPILPAVDPVGERNVPRGIVVAEIFTVKRDNVETFATAAEPIFAQYRAAGAREAGVLVSFDGPNTFPQLTVRTDGPFLVWLGILKDDDALQTDFAPQAARSLQAFVATGLLTATPELVIMDPTPRSRLRWLP